MLGPCTVSCCRVGLGVCCNFHCSPRTSWVCWHASWCLAWLLQLNWLLSAGPLRAAAAVVALLLGLNVARTYQERLRQFLSDIAGESGSSLAAAAGGAKAD